MVLPLYKVSHEPCIECLRHALLLPVPLGNMIDGIMFIINPKIKKKTMI